MKKNKVFIIAEAGSNWKVTGYAGGSDRAFELIDAAKEAGADAVKFQVFSGSPVYVEDAGPSDYLSKNGITRPINDLFKELGLPHSKLSELSRYCEEKNIEFMASFFSEADFKAVEPYVKRHKIASYEISHIHLLRLAAMSGKPLILSTGASEIEDISWAVEYFKGAGGNSLTLMQCTAKYPARLEELNLRVIPELAKMFGVSVGFSDHSMHPWIGPAAAVALGAVVIEKHFTLSRKLAGPDHAFAIEPDELKRMVKEIRSCEQNNTTIEGLIQSDTEYKKTLGVSKKIVFPEERELRDYAQRGVQAIQDIKEGDELRENGNVAILRPGKKPKGMHPMNLSKMEGRKARSFIPKGHGIRDAHYA